jgi:hypothetical protein
MPVELPKVFRPDDPLLAILLATVLKK